jgi:hypothetical protein
MEKNFTRLWLRFWLIAYAVYCSIVNKSKQKLCIDAVPAQVRKKQCGSATLFVRATYCTCAYNAKIKRQILYAETGFLLWLAALGHIFCTRLQALALDTT